MQIQNNYTINNSINFKSLHRPTKFIDPDIEKVFNYAKEGLESLGKYCEVTVKEIPIYKDTTGLPQSIQKRRLLGVHVGELRYTPEQIKEFAKSEHAYITPDALQRTRNDHFSYASCIIGIAKKRFVKLFPDKKIIIPASLHESGKETQVQINNLGEIISEEPVVLVKRRELEQKQLIRKQMLQREEKLKALNEKKIFDREGKQVKLMAVERTQDPELNQRRIRAQRELQVPTSVNRALDNQYGPVYDDFAELPSDEQLMAVISKELAMYFR